jgi:medium-chain acyl-[acyl-carrier-protein] hydrolase
MTFLAADWYDCATEPVPGDLDLVVFPYAGGNPASFRRWHRGTTGCRTLVASLPGRGTRFAEEPLHDFDTLVARLADELAPRLTGRYALFGHSLGAYLAYEVARRLPDPPSALLVSGADDPAGRLPRASRQSLTDAEFVAELRRMGGTPSVVLDNPELLEFLMPSIRADFAVVDSYVYRPGPQLDCPIHVLAGADDPHTTAAALDGWRLRTSGTTTYDVLPGDHFFVHQSEDAVLRHVRRLLDVRADPVSWRRADTEAAA